MGSVSSCDDSVFISNSCRSCFYSLDCEEFCVKHGQSSLDDTKKNASKVISDDLESCTSKEYDFNDSMVKVLGNSLWEIVHIQDHPGALGVSNPSSNQGNICKQMEAKPVSFDTDVPKGLNKCESILCSELMESHHLNSDADGLLCKIEIIENHSKAQNFASVQPVHATTELIPALKGSRALYGKHVVTKLSVKWAPDVYDPPVTSSSHTVKGPCRRRHHQHHAKSKRDHHNQGKCSKGKPYRSTSTVAERRHTTRRRSSLTDPRVLRLQALECKKPMLNGSGQSKFDSLDLAVSINDDAIMYGSSCCLESLALVRLPHARAA